MAKARNVDRATVVGGTVGAVAMPAVSWGAAALEAKTGIPAFVTMPLLGGAAAFLLRWAAKLNPHD